MNRIILPTDKKVCADVEHVLYTLKETYGFKADMESLPPIMVNPAPDRLKYLVLVAQKITPRHIVEAEHIELLIDLDRVLDFSRHQFTLPPRNALGYWVWMSAGELYRIRAPDEIESWLSQAERTAMMYEGLHLFAQYAKRNDLANITKGKSAMLFPGSRSGHRYVPCVRIWEGGPRLFARSSARAHPRYGSASCGSFVP